MAPLGKALPSPDHGGDQFGLEGHSSTTGSTAFNQVLSERRSDAVRGYPARRFGVGPERLQVAGLGVARLAVPTLDRRSEPRNRRVQVVNLGR